jgi:1-deoxy-D-xylulose-5-phosphate reductoisomerase
MAVTAKVERAAPTPTAPRRITILGATGSVGRSTIDIVRRRPEAFVVEALTAHRDVAGLVELARQLRPKFVAIADPACHGELVSGLSGLDIEVGSGREATIEAAARPGDWLMAGIVGAAGLEPTLTAIRRGAIVALANKECLVCAGEIMLAEIERHGAVLLPVDSEHNAVFQVFDRERRDSIERIILTASGGPFREWSRERMAAATPDEAVRHPIWQMGAKISVDSATLMNKGLEIIEAHFLFGISERQIEVVLHPQSVIHSMVGYVDGSVLAQLGSPDMRTPIAYALAWPQRMATPAARLDLAAIGQLSFQAPDIHRFPALRLAREALQSGGAAPTILNAANEAAVAGFLAGRIGFLDIARVVESTLESVAAKGPTSVAEVRAIDREARTRAEALLGRGRRTG